MTNIRVSVDGQIEELILKDFVFIRKKDSLEKVKIHDILFLQSDGNYCEIYTDSKKFIIKMSLIKASKILSSNNFIRINKSIIVNINKVSRILLSNNQMILGDKSFLIGRTYKAQIINRLKLLT